MGVVENPAAPGTPSSPVTADWLSPEAAVRAYVRYEARYRARYRREYARRGRTPDCRLAWHAAFPLYLTAELLNLIHANFLGGEGIPWHAEADFLLSPLCRPAGPGLYRVDPVVREVLLLELVRNMPRPAERLLRLADFLLAYVERHPDPAGGPELARAYRWIAAAYLRPGWAAAEMRQTIERTAADIGTPAELPAQAQQLQVAQLSAVLHAPLAAGLPAERYADVLEASDILARYWYRGPAAVASSLATAAPGAVTAPGAAADRPLKVQVVTALRRVAAAGPGGAAAAGEQGAPPAPARPPASEFEPGPEVEGVPEAAPEPPPASRWGPELIALRDLLAQLYVQMVEGRRVAEMAGLRVSMIAFSNRAIENWHNILDLARVEGRVPDVLRVARADFPQNDALRALEEELVGAAGPRAESRSMRLYLALSPRIVTGRTFLLGAALREADSPPPNLDLPIAASHDVAVSWPPDVEWLTLRMEVVSNSAVPNGEPVSYLRLRRDKEPAVAYFELTPKLPGPVELRLSLHRGEDLLGSVTAEITAEQSGQPEAEGRADENALAAIMVRLRDTLAKLYSDPQSVRRVLSDAGLSPVQTAQVPYSETSSMEAWDAALRVARRAGRLGSLIEVATRDFTRNTDLGRVAAEYRKWVERYGEPDPGREPEPARLEDPELATLHDLFAGLYPEVGDVRRVAANAGLDAEQLRFAATAYDSWHAILEEAQREGKVRKLIDVVRQQYPRNPELQRAAEAYPPDEQDREPRYRTMAKLRDLLARLYPEEANFQRLVREVGLNPAMIRWDPNRLVMWHEILIEAEKRGKLLDFVRLAAMEHPDVPELAQAERELDSTPEPQANEPPIEGDLGKRPTEDFPDCCATGDGSSFYGSGVLVAPQLVLTAGSMQSASRVFLGGSDVRQLEAGEVINVIRNVKHPELDLRALFLERPASVAPRPIALGADDAPPAEALFAGFGTIDRDGRFGFGRKRYVQLPITSLGCESARDAKRYGCQEGRELVAGGQGRDSSTGDAGGPLYVAGPDGGYLLLATCSRSARGRTTTAGDGGIYVRIDRALNWLRSIAGNDPGHEIKTARATGMSDSKAE